VTAGLDVQTGTNDMFAYQDLVDSGDILVCAPSRPAPAFFPTTTSSPPKK